jgi:hypothetical protein
VLRSDRLGQKLTTDILIIVSRRSLFCYELRFGLFESKVVTPAFASKLSIYIRLSIGLRCCFRVEVVEIFSWLNLCAIRFQQLFISLQFGMKTFSVRFCSFSLPTHRGNKAALLLCLGAIGAGSAPVAFDLALPTSQARVAFEITVWSKLLRYRELTHIWICFFTVQVNVKKPGHEY